MGFAKLPLIVAVLPLPLQPQMVIGGVCDAVIPCRIAPGSTFLVPCLFCMILRVGPPRMAHKQGLTRGM
jgi:hypothetical protein